MTDSTSTHVDASVDPRTRTIEGVARMGNTSFAMPLISKIQEAGEAPNGEFRHELWTGGCLDGLTLPEEIEFVVSLYPWERYLRHSGVRGWREERLYDSRDRPNIDQLVSIATTVNEYRSKGPTLVHCQAGLNRSGLVAALSLILDGHAPADAIALLRRMRSPAVLCNSTFEELLLELSAT